MLVNYEGYNFVVDPDIDFVMLQNCYHSGGNCLNCMERVFDGCPIDDIDIEELIKYGDTVVYEKSN
mgnify:CR=1 FL=1